MGGVSLSVHAKDTFGIALADITEFLDQLLNLVLGAKYCFHRHPKDLALFNRSRSGCRKGNTVLWRGGNSNLFLCSFCFYFHSCCCSFGLRSESNTGGSGSG